MKKNWLLLVLTLFSLSMGLSSCSDDDDNQKVVESIYGTYLGEILEVELNGLPLLDGKSIPEKIHLTQGANGKAHFELKDFSFEGIALGDIKLNEVDLWNAGARHEFHGKEKINLVVGECDTELTGSIDKKGNITWKVNVTIEEEDATLNVIVDFEGKKLVKDLSSEAEIIELVFEEDKAEENKLVVDIEQNENDYLIVVDAITTDSDLKKLVPTISISEKATITPESGVAQDFTKGVVYTVTSEDGIKTVKYTVKLRRISPLFFDFEEWVYETPEEVDEGNHATLNKLPKDQVWGSSNLGARLLIAFGMAKEFMVQPTTDSFEGGNAASIKTIEAKGAMAETFGVPKITAGSLFFGEFSHELNIENPLANTKFGVEYKDKPLTVKGYYKYKAGANYYVVKEGDIVHPVLDNSIQDKCAIRAVLYEVEKDSKGNIIYLDGSTIGDKSKHVAYAELEDGGEQTEFTPFELDLEYVKEYDSEKDYMFALIFSSSKDGDKFSGAPDSELIIDNVEIINEVVK